MATQEISTAVVPGAETALVTRIRAGESAAEEELVNTYRRRVLVIATARTHDPEAARDLAQEVLMAVLMALREGHLREPEKLAAFIQGTARNLINNYLRTCVRRAEDELEETQAVETNPEEELQLRERRRLLERELQALGAVDQQILLLSLVDGHPLDEVAARLQMSHEAVRARKSRAVRKIMKKFATVSRS